MIRRGSEAVARALVRGAGELAPVLRAYHASTGVHATLWGRGAGAVVARSSSHPAASEQAPPEPLPAAGQHPVAIDDGRRLLLPLAGIEDVWLTVGPAASVADLAAHAHTLQALAGAQLRTAVEAEQAAGELSERYEEINLLYTISEILGSAVTLEQTASTILTEIAETVGARRAVILVHDRVTDTLGAVAARGVALDGIPPIAVSDQASVTARVFRTLHPTIVAPEEPGLAEESGFRAGALLSVPIVWSTPGGGEPLGVVHLSGRSAGPFTAGDQKLVTAIASQIAAAIQNARLVRASLQQQRLSQEMALANDLQMKLLPRVDVAAPHALVAARVEPAESVGGDFYNLFRLGDGVTGVMIGDVSSHGYRAALIMALAMSATGIHAQASQDPSTTLGSVLRSMREELESTEMYIAAFYAVVDARAGVLHYANAGHPHAFVVGADGTIDRLPAGAPPLGMVDDPPATHTRPWRAGSDLLLLFTDGISDALDPFGRRLGEEPVLEMARDARGCEPEEIVARVFDALARYMGAAPPRDDLTLVVLRS